MANTTSALSSEAVTLQLQMDVLRQEFNELKASIGCSHTHKLAQKMPCNTKRTWVY